MPEVYEHHEEDYDSKGRLAYLTELDEHPGSDCLTKGLQVGWKGFAVGAIYGSAKAAVTESPSLLPGIFPAFKMVGHYGTFVGTVGAVFACTTCFSNAIRQKDDYKNWVYGGAASGVLCGLKTRRVPIGVAAALGFGLLMGLIKQTEVYKDPIPYKSIGGTKPIDRPW